MSGKTLRSEQGWAAVAPWNTAPWLHSVSRTRADVVVFLNERFGEDDKSLAMWKAEGWRFVRVTVAPVSA